ncbi:RNA polymerase sigma-70 factor [Spirosoma sp. BT702]|uniref:RNA polymerase sigma-70 factor n=1 Tax=Spirosoma profusum TaxID=2771354 RepID=A0A927APW0_9BACT|nr:RNA polymerase sigma-70 factor [Spirosoma profusum]MBD2699163.1 RNA polymerase sigma-70 factor [Spirosoma profusum]
MTVNYTLESVLHQVIQGDPVAFAKLYRHYRTPALKFCTSLLKDTEDAENMVHDVFIKIWERRATINPSLNFNSYLFTCLRNLAFDHLKQLEKSQLLKQRYVERMQVMNNEHPDDEEARIQLLQVAISSLSEKRKLILRMNVEDGKSYQEIAEMLRISKNTVKNQLVKAKQLLREKVDFALI